jgi:carboxypeptidase Taq
MSAYENLEQHHRRLSHLDHVAAILGWDEETMMPMGGGEARAEASGTLAELRHEKACNPRVGEWLEAASSEPIDEWQRANLERMQRLWVRDTALSGDLVGARARAASRCQQGWRTQRPANDWDTFRPLLEEVLKLEREASLVLGEATGLDPYDALIDAWDPGLRQATINPIFDDLSSFLPGFIERAVEATKRRGYDQPVGPFSVESQRKLGVATMESLGFDFEHGRLDVSAHPFCGGVPRDVRITTRYDEGDFTSALMGVIHETGHGMYEQGLPEKWLDQPVGGAMGMSVHESQSLFWEMQVARGRPFLELLAPRVRKAFGDVDQNPLALDNLQRLYTRVERGYIRVNADEATYPTHILLRYELEKDLVAGRTQVADIPERWSEGMQRLLGLSTDGNYKDGCMQDVHWPAGVFGYFPSYTLGAMTAAQLFATVCESLPGLDAKISAGDFTGLRNWLRERVWSQGSRFSLAELMQRATGQALDAKYYKEHLERRYLAA